MATETKRKLAAKTVGSIDNTVADVVKWDKEGRTLFFEDNESTFIKLDSEVVRGLSTANRMRYQTAKQIAGGVDVISSMTTAIQGFDSADYAVRPGSASANLAVLGKDKDTDYYWERKENVNKRRSEGWIVNTDSNVRTLHDESCSYKTVGGENNPEMILVSRPKSITIKENAEKKLRRDAMVGKATNTFRESVERVGGEAIID